MNPGDLVRVVREYGRVAGALDGMYAIFVDYFDAREGSFPYKILPITYPVGSIEGQDAFDAGMLDDDAHLVEPADLPLDAILMRGALLGHICAERDAILKRMEEIRNGDFV